jgi:hypothetical protein
MPKQRPPVEKLTGQADVGVVDVDVSNVCRDDRLPGTVGLSRLDLVLNAWREQLSRHAEFHLVADRSLLRDLSRDDKRLVKRMRRAGELSTHPVADGVLLDHAEAHGGCVLSRDRFLDERPGRVWMRERFFTWVLAEDGVRIVQQASRNTQPFDVSRKVEQKLARSRGFPDLHHQAALKRWACVSDADCLTRRLTPDALQVLPLLVGDIPICPGCRQPLHDLGMRPNEAELKLVVDDTSLARFTLRQGERVSFGRLTMPDTAALAELAREGVFAGLGRVHADLRLAGRRVAVRPVDDRHRVEVRRWDSRRRRFQRGRELHHAEGFTAIGLRDTLLLGDRLELVRSGRSIAEAEELPDGNDGAAWRLRSTGGPQEKASHGEPQEAEG